MDRLTPLAWAGIAIIVLVAAAVNAWMVALLHHKDPHAPLFQRQPRQGGPTRDQMERFARLVRNPFIEEQQQLNQLAKTVQELHDADQHTQNPDHP